MKAFFIYNKNSGINKRINIKDLIKNELNNYFEIIDVYGSTSKLDYINKVKEISNDYDVLIFAGGDGTFNMTIEALANLNKTPILAVIPSGSTNDTAKNFKIRNIKQGIKAIKQGNVVSFDGCKISDDHYFAFSASVGSYADIPLEVTRKAKSKIGKFAYYFKAVNKVFKHETISGTLKLDNGNNINFKTGFLLILNSTHIAGFNINPKSNNDDGLIDLFFTKPGPFNGLTPYLLNKKKVTHYQCKKVEILLNESKYWDIDGEEGPIGSLKVEVLDKKFKIYSLK